VGVDVADTADGAHAFIKKYGITYTNVKDTLTTTASVSYGIGGYPETFFINAQGKVVARWIEPLNAQGLRLELAKLHIQV
jgi:cytochrome c biogenesis protein CcmG/thiol:disulfide interchange protein DsbE